ncbi:BCCT family transporter [Falsarthrobacter nasiphocae]|uniref:Choline/glycine/proline betaine transport protein n=1 Tax=Falsarthrobacter nasiphocae TaxID=189863 RepID=A0AAE3YF08_9MICC|nr:BCCT family transporter [Falsarthrobacter nasiphocae]MDR6891497.1 choline/glycine/proline betaine transport protein [Falsarthrobacter nasiphocae]
MSTSNAGIASTGVRRWVFWPAAVIIAAFVGWTLIFQEQSAEVISTIQTNVIGAFGWYYVLIVSGFVAFALWVGASRYGDIKLGKDDDEPEFSLMSWFALLFAAGMGIGLVFWGAAEPLSHFASPPPGTLAGEANEAQRAMTQTFLHWGLHAWSIYVVVGLGIAYAVHRKGRPISIRWALEPLFGEKRVSGGWGNLIDVIALVGTLFGVATSLGLGVLQISSGLEHENIVEATEMTQVMLIVAITALTILSVVSGVEKGMKWLSNANLVIAALLLVVVLFAGPTLFVLREFVQSIGHYLQNVVGMSFNTFALRGDEGEKWQSAWSTFYWGWWISWAPFVGVFIARVSKGRTVRQFVGGVLIVPTLVTFLWFSVMGGSSLYRELFGKGGLVGAGGTVDVNNVLFELLGDLPGGPALVFGALILVAVFFITSADSGAMVMSMISSGGETSPKTWIRVFWAVSAALIAIALLRGDGLTTIQTVAILTAVPFSVVMILMAWSCGLAFHREHAAMVRFERQQFGAAVAERVHDSVQDSVDERLENWEEKIRTGSVPAVDASGASAGASVSGPGTSAGVSRSVPRNGGPSPSA